MNKQLTQNPKAAEVCGVLHGGRPVYYGKANALQVEIDLRADTDGIVKQLRQIVEHAKQNRRTKTIAI